MKRNAFAIVRYDGYKDVQTAITVVQVRAGEQEAHEECARLNALWEEKPYPVRYFVTQSRLVGDLAEFCAERLDASREVDSADNT